ARPHSGPEPALGVELNLYRIHHLRNAGFIGEQTNLKATGHGDAFDRLFTAEIFEGAFFLGAGTFAAPADIRDHRDGLGHIAVIRIFVFAGGTGPDGLVTIGRHNV